jgi:hypothetical protein
MEKLVALNVNTRSQKVIITGHSLGAALSWLAARDIKAQFPNVDISLITFHGAWFGHRRPDSYEGCGEKDGEGARRKEHGGRRWWWQQGRGGWGGGGGGQQREPT